MKKIFFYVVVARYRKNYLINKIDFYVYMGA